MRISRRLLLFGIVAFSFFAGKTAFSLEQPGPQKPSDALKSFRLADDRLMMELVAAEPDVVSPVAIAWDEMGRLFVAQMSDYPAATTGGQIKLLEDRDGDGTFEKVTVFADGLPFPNSVLPWKGGVLVTAAPNIWFLKDNNGDGVADERRVVLTGFGEGNQQLRANGLFRGLDNWVYGANGRSDGSIRRPDQPVEAGVSIRLHDFRFRPETGEVEAVAGFSQFGLGHDSWGNRFPSWNTIPMRHVVLEERYLSRNPRLAQTAVVADILDPADPGRVFSISPPPTTFNREPVDYFNASCGLTLYRGDNLGSGYDGNAFVCESLTNLVHRRVLLPDGPTFLAKRVEQNKEFLASTDPWFHPVNLGTGPDGCLYLVDFYRQSVEHPQFVPEPLRKAVDFRKGAEHGRIWRIRQREGAPPRSVKLGSLSGAELVEQLGSPNGWVRDTAQRLLVERRDTAQASTLVKTVAEARSPLARSHALWTLNALQKLDDAILVSALRDSDAHVREVAARLAEGRAAGSASLRDAILTLATDPKIRNRFRAALLLGERPETSATAALARIAQKDAGDRWVRLAILTGLSGRGLPFLQALVEQSPDWLAKPTAAQAALLAEVASLVGAETNEDALAQLLNQISKPSSTLAPGRIALLAGLTEGLARRGQTLSGLASRVLVQSGTGLETLLAQARQLAASSRHSEADRLLALRVLTDARPRESGPLLLHLLKPDQPQSLQIAAARGLSTVGDRGVAVQALEGWNSYMTSTRREILTALLRSPDQAVALVEAIEAKHLVAAELDLVSRDALLRLANPALQPRIQKLFAQETNANRQEVIRKYQSALMLKGDSARGAEVFAKNCLTCHQMRGRGQRVGPDLSGIGSRPKETILADVLDPNKDVSPDYRSYQLVTTRGQVLTGLLAAETANSVTLRRAEGAEDTALRTEIEELRATRQSLMPEGVEQTLNPQSMADLLEFLRSPVPLPAQAAR